MLPYRVHDLKNDGTTVMASGSKFVSHIRLWVILIPILMITFVPLFSQPWVYVLSKTEINSNINVFGTSEHTLIQEKTDSQFTRWFIDTNLYGKSISNKGGGNMKVAEISNDFVRDYFVNFWKMIYRAMYRYNVAWQWLAGGIILIGAAIFDGWQMRNIKKHSIGIGNPLAVHFVLHSFFLLVGSAVTLLFFPIAIVPAVWGGGILLLAAVCWKLAESFQSGSNA